MPSPGPFGRRWESERAQTIGDNDWEVLSVTRPDEQGDFSDDPVEFGLAVTLSVPGELELYEQVHSMVQIRQRV